MPSRMKALTLLAACLLAGCAGPVAHQGRGGAAEGEVESGPAGQGVASLSQREGHALEAEAYRAVAEGRLADASALFGRAAEGGYARAWLALAALKLGDEPGLADSAGAAEALRRYRALAGEPEDALWRASLERQLAQRQERQRQSAELQRLKAELQKKESAIKRLRELTLGR